MTDSPAAVRQEAIRLCVNGHDVVVGADPTTSLLLALRNDVGLIGPRFGCGLGQCGACMVVVGGEARSSCDLPLSDVGDRAVTTIEGLGRPGELHPVQAAIIDEGAGQCGYCLSGIVVAAAALLAAEPAADETRIREALAGNLCRCGAHARIVRAILRARATLGTFAPGLPT